MAGKISVSETKGKAPSNWGKRIVGSLLALMIALMGCGFIYQSIATRQDLKRYPPPGELVDVGGYRLHLYCVGSGSPTVVLEGGLAENWLTWDLVQDEIAGFTQVCAYDRAGLGWSDAAPGAQTSAEVAETLHTLLHNAAIPSPYLLVGHSAGGRHVRSFAGQYPEEVAGLVLVDSYHENQFSRLPAELVQPQLDSYAGTTRMLAITRMLAPFGVVRLFGVGEMFAQENPIIDSLTPGDREMLLAIYNRTGLSQAVKNEYGTQVLNNDLNQPPIELGDIPLIVLAKAGDDPEKLAGFVTAETILEGNRIAFEMQQELADLSTNGSLVIVEDSGHYIQIDQPDAVIEAIREMVASLQ